MGAPIGTVEIDLSNGGYGGDFSLTSNGDLLLAQDTVANPAASLQRIHRLLLTNAAINAADGTPISEADDIFNPSFGASIRALIGQMIRTATISEIQTRINAGLASFPDIASSNITVAQSGSAVVIGGSVTISTGQTVTLPTETLELT